MCGIFAYCGDKKNATDIVLKGLKKLEYRGYDSWGIAYKTQGKIEVVKDVGKISEANLPQKKEANLAVGHTRWATHGGVTRENAHPHFNEDQSIIVVHNGIIENFSELKEKLKKRGHSFRSETDTELIAHMIEEASGPLSNRVMETLHKIDGRYAIVVISKDENALIAARKGSPLIVGIGQKIGEYFIASDIPAFLEYTNNVMYLDDNQMVKVEEGIEFFDLETGEKIDKRIVQVDWKPEMAEKGDHPHFMIKEILEQKDTLSRAINQNDDEIMRLAGEIRDGFGTYLIGCGTAGKVAMTGAYLFSKIAQKHINVEFGSEFPYFKDFIRKGSLVIGISQSGETADTLAAMEVAKAKGARILSIVNVESSTMARTSDYTVFVKAGPEKAVASTKVTTSQIAILTLLAYAMAEKLGEGKRLLIETAAQINDMLNPRYEDHIGTLAEKLRNRESMYIIGKGLNYPMALESAIKLQEVSYIHAEGFAGGELKHGPIALISERTPVIALVAKDDAENDILSNAMEIKSRGGYIIGVSPENHEIFNYWIKVPDAGNASPIVNIIPIQILAYQLSVLRENNPDMPRNLAKSVTVK